MELQGQVALVTGAGRGIGRATAIALAQAGAHVAINYLDDRSEAEEVASQVRQAGAQPLLVQGDVTDYERVVHLVAATVAAFGRLDIAVANAYFSERDFFWKADLQGFRRTVDVTLWGAFYTLRAAAQRMIEQGEGGSIVVVSSRHAVQAIPRAMAYNLSKAAVDHMARTAAIELVDHRIRVNIVHPGWIDTPGERKYTSEEQLARAGAKLPWKRMGRPEEVARGIVFLCDPKSDYMTGGTLEIDGGSALPWWAARGLAAPD
jgi:glucose 1-dehydrogenase